MKTFDIKNHLRTSVIAEKQKDKSILLTAIKSMRNEKNVIEKVKLDKKAVEQLSKSKDYSTFRKTLNLLNCAESLRVDSKAKKLHLTKNTAYDNITNAVAKALNIEKFKTINNYETKVKSKKLLVKKS